MGLIYSPVEPHMSLVLSQKLNPYKKYSNYAQISIMQPSQGPLQILQKHPSLNSKVSRDPGHQRPLKYLEIGDKRLE